MSKSGQRFKMRKKASRKAIDVDKLDNDNAPDEKKDDGTTIYASGAVGTKSTNLKDKATIPSGARRRARTHHSNLLKVTDTENGESKTSDNESKENELKDNNDNTSAITVYASGAVQQVTQVCCCIINIYCKGYNMNNNI